MLDPGKPVLYQRTLVVGRIRIDVDIQPFIAGCRTQDQDRQYSDIEYLFHNPLKFNIDAEGNTGNGRNTGIVNAGCTGTTGTTSGTYFRIHALIIGKGEEVGSGY